MNTKDIELLEQISSDLRDAARQMGGKFGPRSLPARRFSTKRVALDELIARLRTVEPVPTPAPPRPPKERKEPVEAPVHYEAPVRSDMLNEAMLEA